MKKLSLFLLLPLLLPIPESASAQANYAPPSLLLEELTWPEVKQALDAGYTRIIIPTGGVEQGGRHLLLGKHNKVVAYTADKIARKLGKTLIAPVIAYVPEEPHMSFPGTISLSEDTFTAILEETVQSLKHHGFKQIYMLGDSFGNQAPQAEVAEDLAEDFADEGVILATVDEYYNKNNGQQEWLKAQGYTEEEIGGHAGIRDSSEIIAVYPTGLRKEMVRDSLAGDPGGASGRATQANFAIGEKMLELKIGAAIRQIGRIEAGSKMAK